MIVIQGVRKLLDQQNMGMIMSHWKQYKIIVNVPFQTLLYNSMKYDF